jgi:hypothetical protein
MKSGTQREWVRIQSKEARIMPNGTEIRVLGSSGMEDYYAHLLRLDRASCFPAANDGAIDTHCLDLVTAGAILVGAYVDGVMRAAAEIVPDRTARRAEAAITVERGFDDRGFNRTLIAYIVDEARRHRLSELRVLEQSSTTTIQVPERRSYAANG